MVERAVFKWCKSREVGTDGPIAQSVERQTNNLEVMGSIPIGTTFFHPFPFPSFSYSTQISAIHFGLILSILTITLIILRTNKKNYKKL